MTGKEIKWLILSSILGIIGSISFINLLKREDVTFILPNIQPLVLLITSLFGFFLFNEEFSKYKIMGFILIIFGSLIINMERTGFI